MSSLVVSTDAIRGELWGDESDQQHPEKVFNEAYRRIGVFLNDKWDVIFDATNLKSKDRRKLVKRYRKMAEHLICVDFGNDVEKALKQQATRKRKVPVEVIQRQAHTYQQPTYSEGWDIIQFSRI